MLADELDLLRRELPVCPVNLAEDVPCVNEEHLVLALRSSSCPGRGTTAYTAA